MTKPRFSLASLWCFRTVATWSPCTCFWTLFLCQGVRDLAWASCASKGSCVLSWSNILSFLSWVSAMIPRRSSWARVYCPICDPSTSQLIRTSALHTERGESLPIAPRHLAIPATPRKFQELSFRGWSSAYLPSGLSSQECIAPLLNPVQSYGFKEGTAVVWVASHMCFQQAGTGLASGAILGIR